MMLTAIVNVNRSWGIGAEGDLLVHIPEDMKFFRTATKGKTVVMGRKTLESFPGGKPLKGRRNIVLTRQPEQLAEAARAIAGQPEEGTRLETAASLPELLELLQGEGRKREGETEGREQAGEVFVIGGESVYNALLPYCSEVYVTKVAADGKADTFVPDLDEEEAFVLAEEGEPVEDNGYTLRFCTYKNRAPKPF